MPRHALARALALVAVTLVGGAASADPVLVEDGLDPAFVEVVHDALVDAGIGVDADLPDRVDALRRAGPGEGVVVADDGALASLDELAAVRDAFYARDYDAVVATMDRWLDVLEDHPHAFADQADHLWPTLEALLMFVRTLDAIEPGRADAVLARVRLAMWGVHPSELDVPPSVIERWDHLRGPAACSLALDGLETAQAVRVDGHDAAQAVRVDGRDAAQAVRVDGHDAAQAVRVDGRDAAQAVRVDGRDAVSSPMAVPCRTVVVDVWGPDRLWRMAVDPTERDAVDVQALVWLTALPEGELVAATSDPAVIAGAARLTAAERVWVVASDDAGGARLVRVDRDTTLRSAEVRRPRDRDARAAVDRLLAPEPVNDMSLALADPAPNDVRRGGVRAAPLAFGMTTATLAGVAVGLEAAVGGARREVDACADAPACVVSGDIDAWRDTARTRRTAANATWATAGVAAIGWVVTLVANRGEGDVHGAGVRPTASGFALTW